MRFVLALALVAGLAACAKKKPPQNPANAQPAAAPGSGSDDGDMKNNASPDDPDDAKSMRSSDPCEGGE